MRPRCPHPRSGSSSSWARGLREVRPGNVIIVLTRPDRAHRDVLRVHPGGNPVSQERGVFSTRSPDRPNPIGLHRVTVVSVAARRVRVSGLEALDRTPVLDVKPFRELY
jgi:tRNA-Thr(GGU) m(6)t(6)A37 methyltransferase TsaA